MSNLLFALQTCPVDCDAAVDLARLIADIQKVLKPREKSPPWLISYRKDTPISRIESIRSSLTKVFNRVWTVRAERYANGWPAGSNALWRSTMENAAKLKKDEVLETEGVLTFEPDCVPLMLSWIERLEQAYAQREYPIVGNIHDGSSDIGAHVNGNACWPITLATDWPQVLVTPPGVAWDFYHRQFFLEYAEDTPLITQYYRRKAFTEAEWVDVQKCLTRPALLHGVKDGSARALARRHLLGSRTVTVRTHSPQYPAERRLQRPM